MPILDRRIAELDVAVIGAGLSGLTAAWRLRQAGVPRLAVFEAKDRIGGRTHSQFLPGGLPLDLGGQWLGPTQHRVLALADELGLPTFPTPDTGRHVLWLGGRRHVFRSLPPWAAVVPAGDFARAAMRLQWAAWRLDREAPWRHPRARSWDGQTLGNWLRAQRVSPAARAWFDIASGLTLGGDPDDMSLLWALLHIRSAGGLRALLSVRGGAQDRRLVGGAQGLCDALAARLLAADRAAAAPATLQCSRPVARIEWRDAAAGPPAGACIVFADGHRVTARRVIVAMSPPDRARIVFDPPLPPAEAEVGRRMSLFKGIKIQAVYARPFWRDAGLSGQALADQGPAPVAFDNSHPDHPHGVLVSFVAGRSNGTALTPTDAELADPDRRRSAVLGCLARYFGPAAAHPLHYVEKDWRDEPYASGCIPALPPGVLTGAATQAGPGIGPLLWAGTEASHVWNGYLDGAVRAGEAAARRV